MRTSYALLPLLLTVAGACVITQAPPSSSTDTTPPPGPTNAVPPATTPVTTAPAPTSATPTPTTTLTAPTTGVTPPSTGTPGAIPPALIGSWTSPSCGARTYARKIQFDRTGSMEASDLVSPCPPKVQCVWSGIVTNRGTFTVEAGSIKLHIQNPGSGPKSQPLPTTLAMDPSTSAPVEAADGTRCVYTKDTGKP